MDYDEGSEYSTMTFEEGISDHAKRETIEQLRQEQEMINEMEGLQKEMNSEIDPSP